MDAFPLSSLSLRGVDDPRSVEDCFLLFDLPFPFPFSLSKKTPFQRTTLSHAPLLKCSREHRGGQVSQNRQAALEGKLNSKVALRAPCALRTGRHAKHKDLRVSRRSKMSLTPTRGCSRRGSRSACTATRQRWGQLWWRMVPLTGKPLASKPRAVFTHRVPLGQCHSHAIYESCQVY